MGRWEDELETILGREEELLLKIDGQARLKTAALASGNIQAINEIVSREQLLAMQLNMDESLRGERLRQEGLEGLSLSSLIEKAGTPFQKGLKKRLGSMSEITRKIRDRNKLNSELTKMRLEFYSFLKGARTSVYKSDGRPEEHPDQAGLIDRKI